MQNPSQGLQAPLQNHVHLISGHRFPVIASLDLNQALTYLLDAPTIVKSVSAMSWTYFQAPSDGSIYLEWLSPDKTDGRFPSDGYVWADPEATFRQEFRGYTIEVMKHQIGYRLSHDQMASHARTRFHIIAKNPSVNAPPPDPSLWLVHYHQAEHGRILPASQVPFAPQMQQIMHERKWLESQGTLERRDFMLHDRSQWPHIAVPTGGARMGAQGRGMTQPGLYGQSAPLGNAGVQRFPTYYPQQREQPPAKRQRTNASVAGGSADAAHDVSIEEEENTTHGDFFDHLTPRDISMTRYTQHHRWMEEIFSSPYSTSQLVPTDLGLGLMGELKGLTDGILDPPNVNESDKALPPKPREAQPFTNLSKDQLAEFEKRVSKHLEEGKEEIERMKAEHAQRMTEWKKSKMLLQAEKRLRHATWEGHESAVPSFRLEAPDANGATDGTTKPDTVEGIVKEVEGLLNFKISERKEAQLVEKGGLELEREEEVPQPSQAEMQAQALQDAHRVQQRLMGGQQQQSVAASSGTAEPTMYHQDPASMMQRGQVQSGQQYGQQMQVPVPQPAAMQASSSGMAGGEDTTMMGVDVDSSGIDFGDSQLDLNDHPQHSVSMPPPPATTAQQPSSMPQQQPSVQQATSSIMPADSASMQQSGGVGDDSMFNESMFGDLTNTGGVGGDEEADFDFAAAGLDESAFGEATYGMEGGETGQGQ